MFIATFTHQWASSIARIDNLLRHQVGIHDLIGKHDSTNSTQNCLGNAQVGTSLAMPLF